jgi:hypothetical protein
MLGKRGLCVMRLHLDMSSHLLAHCPKDWEGDGRRREA